LWADIPPPSCGKSLCVFLFQLHSHPRPGEIRLQLTVDGLGHTVKEQLLDADVIVKVLKVPDGRRRAANMRMQKRSGVRR
jgi:hypothetical protein